ncbi:MAG: cysteine-rich KTR domain-containing protein [Pygmaiobacter sp.]|nr:cysteine-rich KTR domain-containing protein [Pygmaiobacter sp.]
MRKTTEKESRWVRCPNCGNKTRIKVYEESVLLNFPLFCPRCHKEHLINIIELKMTISKEPDA